MKLSVSKKRLQAIAILAACCILLLATHVDLFGAARKLDGDGLALVMALLLGGCYIQSVKAELHPLVNKLWMLASFLLLPYVMVYMVEYLAGQSASLLSSNIFALNYFWCLAVYAVLFVLTNHYRGSVIAGSVFCYVVGIVNYFVLLFRSSPLQLTDVMSIGTAADVAGNYVIAIDRDLLVTGSIVFLTVCAACVAQFSQKRRQWYQFVGTAVLLVVTMVSVNQFYDDQVWKDNQLELNFWNPLQGYQENGTVLSLAMEGKYLRPEKPAHYSVPYTEEIIMGAAAEPTDAAPAVAVSTDESEIALAATPENPNIIAIMNESYADLSILGDFKTSVPYMSFYQSLIPDTIHGNLSVSVLGGGTCNSEFEFLTGLTTAFLPSSISMILWTA